MCLRKTFSSCVGGETDGEVGKNSRLEKTVAFCWLEREGGVGRVMYVNFW